MCPFSLSQTYGNGASTLSACPRRMRIIHFYNMICIIHFYIFSSYNFISFCHITYTVILYYFFLNGKYSFPKEIKPESSIKVRNRWSGELSHLVKYYKKSLSLLGAIYTIILFYYNSLNIIS